MRLQMPFQQLFPPIACAGFVHDVQTVRDTINAIISGPRWKIRAETPISAQPAPTTPPTVAEGGGGADSTPEGKQPVQSATAPRECEGAFAEMQRMLKEKDEKEAQRQSENDGMDWLPLR